MTRRLVYAAFAGAMAVALAGSAGGSTRGNCGPSAAWLGAGSGTLIVGAGSEALARIR